MKKRTIGAITSGIVLLSIIGAVIPTKSTDTSNKKPIATDAKSRPDTVTETKPTCDGNVITSKCVLNNINYKTYVYHLAIPEKTHTEQVTTYEKKIIGYCTLCNDGTYSPSCATGRGACSHHGGVAQWNAPEYSNTPVYSTKIVVDAPAKDAYYEKVTE